MSSGHFLDLGGWRAHVLRWPGAPSSPVVLLHGYLGHAHTWHHLAGTLAPAHDVLALDQRGHGRSAPTSEHGTRPMVDDVGRLLDAVGVERATIVGQSMGGTNAFLFAARHPDRVDRLVVIDIGPDVAPEGRARLAALAGRPQVFDTIDAALADARATFPDAAPELLRCRVEHGVVADGHGRWTWRIDPSLRDGTAVRDDHTAEERWDAWRRVQAPTLLVHGARSDILTPPLVAELVAARPDLEVVDVEGAGHAVPLDAPGALADAVAGFLGQASLVGSAVTPGPA